MVPIRRLHISMNQEICKLLQCIGTPGEYETPLVRFPFFRGKMISDPNLCGPTHANKIARFLLKIATLQYTNSSMWWRSHQLSIIFLGHHGTCDDAWGRSSKFSWWLGTSKPIRESREYSYSNPQQGRNMIRIDSLLFQKDFNCSIFLGVAIGIVGIYDALSMFQCCGHTTVGALDMYTNQWIQNIFLVGGF